ncbi:hypothetical protein CcCBS67573_g06387 [Chytriomyces confervae]|uniref:ABC-type glycine betaine transport system substrate-binding domain-containing protein n=1 Tax=Chytriomyces confervae TaxID=246404 RepID=A0A507F6E8_9FUNG|nr:hypothetical protein HDU80_002784 [Chytriomyces hyalinus]TPX70958.1 hypothetical protein CcCBS67573_g06387 [Chytriomyces confervae]
MKQRGLQIFTSTAFLTLLLQLLLVSKRVSADVASSHDPDQDSRFRKENPKVDWEKYGYLPYFVTGPSCPLHNNTYGWKDLKNPDGSRYTYNKRPVVVQTEGWDSFQLNSYLFQYLLEVMGYRVQIPVMTAGKYGPNFADNVVDLSVEMWPEDTANYAQMTQIDRIAVDLGATGYAGIIGLYVPSALVEQYPKYGLDFWRFLLNSDATKLFPPAGTGPRIPGAGGGPMCDGEPKSCMNGTYTPERCKLPESNCIELWMYDPAYSPQNFQRIIDSLNLNVSINFLGFGAEPIMQKALDEGKNVFLYNWQPNAFTAVNNLTRVLLPATDHEQYHALSKDRMNARVTTDVPTIIIHKLASQGFLADFPELVLLANSYQVLDASMNAMLRSTVEKGYNHSTAACEWMRANELIWGSWIPNPPKSAVDCSIGFGRYLTGSVFTCIPCPSSTYNWNNHNEGACTECPDHLHCPGGPVVQVSSGYWMANITNTTLERDPEFYKCPILGTCCSSGYCEPGECSPSFTGLLCTECADPDEHMWNHKCHKCGPAGGASFWLILFGAFVGAAVLLYLPYEEAPTVEILFFYFQVTYYIFEHQANGIFTLPGLSTFLAIASLNVDGMVSDCTLPLSGVPKLVFRYFLPLLLMFYIVLIYLILRALQSSGMINASSAGKLTPYYMQGQPLSLICFRAMIVVLTFVVMPLVDSSLLLLQCNTVQEKYVLFRSPSVECFGSEHGGGAALAVIFLILLLIALPSMIWLVLSRLHKSGNITYEEEGISNIQRLFQCLYIVFKPDMYYMLPVTIIEKGVTSILFTMLIKYEENIQINVFILFLAFLCATRIYFQPYHNHLEAYLNREISLGILVMIAYRQYTEKWVTANYQKHEEVIMSQASKVSSKMGSQSKHSANGSTTDISVSRGKSNPRKMRGSIEKLEKVPGNTGSLLRSKQTGSKLAGTVNVSAAHRPSNSGHAIGEESLHEGTPLNSNAGQ